MKVPGRNRAVKIVIIFMLKLSLAVFLRISVWMDLSFSAIKLRSCKFLKISIWMDLSLSAIKLRACKEANIRVVFIYNGETASRITYHSNVDVNMLLQAFDIRFVLPHLFPHHHQFVVVTYLLFATIQLSKCLR